jgi:RNA polymerase sigma-70 factor (ECF subfamily)
VSNSLLVEQCRAQNPRAQTALYSQYCEGMFIVASRYLKDTAEAEDAMQVAFIKAFKKIAQFKGDVSFGAWLKRIVINTCLDTLKKKKIHFEEINEQTLSIEQQEDQSWSVDNHITKQLIEEAIEKLSPNYKSVVQLFLFEGYDHQEIAQVLDITQSASRTKLHRGKIQLQQHLKQLHHGTGY